MLLNEHDRIDQLEKEIAKLKVQLQVLVEYLTTANTLPILGADRWADYSTTIRTRDSLPSYSPACLSRNAASTGSAKGPSILKCTVTVGSPSIGSD